MNKTSISIKGTHCKSCEILIEDELKKIHDVKKVEISHKTGIADIYHKGQVLAHLEIEQAVKDAGYEIGNNKKPAFFSTKIQDYSEFIIAFIVALLLYLIAKEVGLFQLVSSVKGEYSNLLVVLLVGLTAGVSTCMALVGGLVLGITSSYSQTHKYTSSFVKFTPHLFFNLGRIIGFFILGGLIGKVGSVFQISTGITGGLTVLIGSVMVFFGLQLIGIFPRLSSISLTLPKKLSRIFGISEKAEKTYSHIETMILGGLTFFLPCGFTQAMQLFAIGSGSFLSGALVMSIFALGTAPGLLGIGGLTAFLKGSFSRYFYKFAGIVVIAMAIFNMGNGVNLLRTTGLLAASSKSIAATQDSNVTIENGVQIVRMIQNASGYLPNSFTIKKDIPVKWIVKSEETRSCASSLVVPKLNIRVQLTEKEQVFEFTPKELGEISFSCSMGMHTGVFNVVEN